ncbi:MAG: hypothetical protein F6J98_48435 [Moorea sp. SIO4G2]|nr:hypothetical protein [Moorena sp. SIO4G2]
MIYRIYEVHYYLTLIPCLVRLMQPIPITYSLFPVPCSLFPKIHKLCTS